MDEHDIAALSPLEQVHYLMDGLVAHATDGCFDGGDAVYRSLRAALHQNPRLAGVVPQTIRSCSNLSQVRSAMKRFAHYQERREFLWAAFAPMIDYLESSPTNPADDAVSQQLLKLSPESVHEAWRKALDRIPNDPEGAITMARTLIETVCKYILDDAGLGDAQSEDLPRLYHLVAERLNLAPSQHEERIFKTILGSCQAVVGGLGELRNKVGDAHGQSRGALKPKPRHAELAVNLAGTMSAFLVATWLDQPRKGPIIEPESTDGRIDA